MILVIGSKGHANVAIDIIEQQGKFNIFGLIDPNEVKGKKVGGYKIYVLRNGRVDSPITYEELLQRQINKEVNIEG